MPTAALGHRANGGVHALAQLLSFSRGKPFEVVHAWKKKRQTVCVQFLFRENASTQLFAGAATGLFSGPSIYLSFHPHLLFLLSRTVAILSQKSLRNRLSSQKLLLLASIGQDSIYYLNAEN